VEPRSAVGEHLYGASHRDRGGDRNSGNLRCEPALDVFCVNAMQRFASWKERGDRCGVPTRLEELCSAPVELAGTVEFGH
jgi:hypothetical protein